MEAVRLRQRIRLLLSIFIAGLFVSGVTAFPLETELRWLTASLGVDSAPRVTQLRGVVAWLVTVRDALTATNARYPFLSYGTDWLAFAHLVLAIVFVGPWREPVRNVWVIQFGLIACAAVLPLALIAGVVREIPFYWRVIDCSFGVIGALVLWPALRDVRRLELLDARTSSQ